MITIKILMVNKFLYPNSSLETEYVELSMNCVENVEEFRLKIFHQQMTDIDIYK